MARYIDADKMQDFLAETNDMDDWCVSNYSADWISSFIESQPTADVVEVKRGYWKECFEDWRKQIAGNECSACGFQHYGTCISHYHYCPNCGAKMDEKKVE